MGSTPKLYLVAEEHREALNVHKRLERDRRYNGLATNDGDHVPDSGDTVYLIAWVADAVFDPEHPRHEEARDIAAHEVGHLFQRARNTEWNHPHVKRNWWSKLKGYYHAVFVARLGLMTWTANGPFGFDLRRHRTPVDLWTYYETKVEPVWKGLHTKGQLKWWTPK